jgi:O-succinylbenzoate synthase
LVMGCRGPIKPGEEKCKQKVWFAHIHGLVEAGAVKYRLQYRRYHLTLRAPLRTAHGVVAEREGLIVRLEEARGNVVGWGEAATLPWFGTESVDEGEAAIRELGKYVTVEDIGRLPVRLGCLRHAFASVLATPVIEGATKPWPVVALLPAGRAALERLPDLTEAGFRNFKWKVGVESAADELVLLDDVCALLPEGAKLRLDANGAWDRRTAERWLERTAERPVEFVEQPCLAEASQGTALLRKMEDMLLGLAEDYPTPIALDESLVGDGDVEHWLRLGWRGIFVIKPSLCGDLPGLMAKLDTAKAQVVFSSALETGIGAKQALRYAFNWPGERRALGFGVWPMFADARYDGPTLAPSLRQEDIQRINEEAVWNALS